MKRVAAMLLAIIVLLVIAEGSAVRAYVFDTTAPSTGGCPQWDRWSLSPANPLIRRWSTSLPLAPPAILTSAPNQASAQLDEIGQAIADSFAAWTGVSGTTFNATAYPGLVAPMTRVNAQNACSNDVETNVDGLNTICFNQASAAFTTGVLAFTRVITANAPGVSIGSGPPSAFAGQILDADTLFRRDGQATFATPQALATPQGQGAYDLGSLLTHELGHWFGLDHSAVWRAMMFPYAPPGQFLGQRPTAQIPDGALADDDRTAVRALYPDPNDSAHAGSIRGRIVPANPFALAAIPPASSGRFVTGIVGASVVAVDADSGSVVAGTLSGWTCDAASPPLQFDGSFDIERLPVGHNYVLYAEPLDGLATPSAFGVALGALCPQSGPSACTLAPVNTNFNPRVLPGAK